AWCTWRDEPNRIDALPVVQRGQPKSHELPERIAEVAAHPSSDLIVWLGADTGRIYVVDLDGRRSLRVVGPVGIDRAESVGLVVGRVGGVLAARAKRPVWVFVIARSNPEQPAAQPESIDGPPTMVSVGSPHHAD